MDRQIKQRFMALWDKYFHGAEWPIAYYYTNDEESAALTQHSKGFHCFICDLADVRGGKALSVTTDTVGCPGGKRYLGFAQSLRSDFEYFLSCGIPGKMEGERYKKSPELVRAHLKHHPSFEAPGKYIVFRRWDALGETDEPLVVTFFATPDILSGLFTLASYDEEDPNSVVATMGSGCASIVDYPYHESRSEHPRAVLGMFDVSARPCVPDEVLTFAIPWVKFVSMVDNMEESFLITKSWDAVRTRIGRHG
jgi:uncharacterized protein (DUF169 family)